jgi:uncharacterized protein YhaN
VAARPPLEAGYECVRRFEQARAERAERKSIDEQLAEKRRVKSIQGERIAIAEARLSHLVEAAGVAHARDLEAAERRSAEARALIAELADVEAKLTEQGDGLSIDDLAREASATSPEEVAARRDEIERRVAELDEQIPALDQSIGRIEVGRARFSEATAADAAAEAQEKLAKVRAHAERYLRARMAELVLAREIARYREANQGPLLARASTLFGRLTIGAYTGLRAAFDSSDREVLRAAREGASDVPVEALSDGARDQLYLALRVASLERLAAAGTALPVVLDDILVHFDDARARAALVVLAELAQEIQVLFFTHNQHIVDIARAAIPRQIVVHDLPPRAAVRAEAGSGATIES